MAIKLVSEAQLDDGAGGKVAVSVSIDDELPAVRFRVGAFELVAELHRVEDAGTAVATISGGLQSFVHRYCSDEAFQTEVDQQAAQIGVSPAEQMALRFFNAFNAAMSSKPPTVH